MSSLSFKLYSVEKPLDSKLKFINEALPKPIFRIILQGCSGSGKSSLIKNILFNPTWGYNRYFSENYLWINSLDDIDELKQLCSHYNTKNISIQQKFDNYAVNRLYDEIERDNAKRTFKSRVLMVYDDQATDNITNKTKTNAIDRIFCNGRHANISCIISTQKYKLLNNNIRCLNCTHLFVFSGTNASDLESISQEHCVKYNKEQMMDIFRKYLDKKYSFVVIDNVNHKILDKDFNEIILSQ